MAKDLETLRTEFLTKADVARECKVSPRTVDHWIASRRLRYFKLGRLVRIRRSDLQKSLEKFVIREVEI
jgi:excisionase family DNA binding protein